MKYFLIFLMDGVVKEISSFSSDEKDSRDKCYEFWERVLEESGGIKQRDYYTFNELQTLDQVW